MFKPLLARISKIGANGPSGSTRARRKRSPRLALHGQPETNVEPLERSRYEELFRVAELHVGDTTGLATSERGRALAARPVGRDEWASRTLDAYLPLFE